MFTIWHLLNQPEQKSNIRLLKIEGPVVVPAWPESHQRWLTPGGDALLQCYDSMPFHQTGGPAPVSANPAVAGGGSNRERCVKTGIFEQDIIYYITTKGLHTRWPSSSLRSAALVSAPADPGISS